MRKIRFIPLIILLFCSVFVHAQSATTAPVEMADGMRSDGKIYVVVGVLVIILFGLLAYLISVDRKVSRVEKSIEEEQNKK
jgi:ABC-type spermidine/putrescine transport system permease subunit II